MGMPSVLKTCRIAAPGWPPGLRGGTGGGAPPDLQGPTLRLYGSETVVRVVKTGFLFGGEVA
jgi:hypothetical protein